METRRPEETPFKQQRLEDWQPKLNINGLISIYFIIGCIFIPIGVYLQNASTDVAEYHVVYDGSNAAGDCSIASSNSASNCTISFEFTHAITGPLYVYYQVDHFYQNHRRYVKSRSANQLMGQNLEIDSVSSDCYPMISNGSNLLNPCGLIANTFFNDVIALSSTSTTDGYVMDSDGIAWAYDTDVKFSQVEGFVSSVVTDSSQTCVEVLGDDYTECKRYTDPEDGLLYYYWYPDDDTVQYLHESFPQISPIDGVTDEHFINWMRTAGLPSFRKLYGKIDSDFSAGDTLSFDMELNFEVMSYGGSKALVVTNLGVMGTKSQALSNSYIAFGVISLAVGFILAMKRLIKPRLLGDIRELSWNSY